MISDTKFSIQQDNETYNFNMFNYMLNDAPNETPVALFIIDANKIQFIVLLIDNGEYLLYGNPNAYNNRRFNGVQPLPPVIPLFTTGIPIYTRAVKYLVAQINPPQNNFVMPGEDITYQNPLYQNAQHLIQPPHQDHPPLPPYQTQYLIQPPRQDPPLPPYQTPPLPSEQLELLYGIINCIFDTYKGILAPDSFRQRFANFGHFYNSEARHEEKDDLGEAETFILDEQYKPTIKENQENQRCNIMGGNIKRRRRQTNKKKNKKIRSKKRRTSFRRK